MTELALRNGDAHASSLIGWAEEARAAALIARTLAPTPFVPDTLKVRDGQGRLDLDATVAQVSAALLTGQELGLMPMASLRSIDIIKGTPALRAATLRAIVQSQGHSIVVAESTASRAVVRARRAGTGETMEATWTIDRARQLDIAGREQWRKQPQSMLLARATAEAARWVAADAILGLPYVAEEIDPDTGAPTDAGPEPEQTPGLVPQTRQRTARRRTPMPAHTALGGPLPPPPPPPAARGRAEGAAAGPGSEAEAADTAEAPDPDAADGGGQTAAPGEPAPPVSSHDTGPAATHLITSPQLKKLHAMLGEANLSDRDLALRLLGEWIGRDLDTTKNLTREEASAVFDALQHHIDSMTRQLAGDSQPPVNETFTPDTPEENSS